MTRSKSSSPAAFRDVKHVLDLAVKKPGLRYKLKSPGKAVNFKQRCNIYRRLVREMAAETLMAMPGMRAETAYDCIIIRQINDAGEPDRKLGCILVFDHQELGGELFDPETGEQIELPNVSPFLEEQ